MSDDPKRALLRHCLATLAYRGGKAVRGLTAGQAAFEVAPGTRTPAQILAHVGDLLDWAASLVLGKQAWHDSEPLPWEQEVARFHAGLARLDELLAAETPLAGEPERLFQGPIADALTHVGQIALLSRLAGAPLRGENYHRARITAGRVGPDQPAPEREFG